MRKGCRPRRAGNTFFKESEDRIGIQIFFIFLKKGTVAAWEPVGWGF